MKKILFQDEIMRLSRPLILFWQKGKRDYLHLHYISWFFLFVPSLLHDPVLLDSVMEVFSALPSDKKRIVIDATLGLGWHASEICKKISSWDIFLGLDRDGENLEKSKSYIEQVGSLSERYFAHTSFSHILSVAEKYGIDSADYILYDLGVSSVHYDEGERGFSTRFDGPLDMRFDRTHGKTATDIIMETDLTDLVRIFTLYGEEKKSWFIANAIIKARKEYPIDTTGKLLKIIETSSFDPKSAIRVFQALRIVVNDEFAHIENSLRNALSLLSPGGLLAVITFHSLEDRLVKQLFSPYLEDTIDDVTGQIREKAKYRKYTKKPIIPTEEEIARNPRSRSAKMRVIQRL